MRIVLIVLWCFALFIGTCNESVSLIFTDFRIHFNLNSHPMWSDLWRIADFHSNAYIIQKIGHFFGFFILSVLMTNYGRYKKGLIWAISYGVITELVQPFFNRDARILDMVINTAGTLLAYFLCITLMKMKRKEI